ncbi:MAG: M28 family peptidase [Gemmatimonadetes bacterium]|nr:M28 family peptidase [Gemmatimonadota bacterium]
MRSYRPFVLQALSFLAVLLLGPGGSLSGQRSEPLKTPLSEDAILLFSNEISGQMAFDNMVKLAGAPWLRSPEELTGEGNFYESEEIYRMARAYGVETVRFDRYEAPGTFTYPLAGELWVDGRRMARVPADAALVASGSQSGEVEGRLIYIPEVPQSELPDLAAEIASDPDEYRGTVALMWSHPRGAMVELLDNAGVQAVISFSSRERYFDPDQVVYARGSYGQNQTLRLGFNVSWRQWSEMLEDVHRGLEVTIRGKAEIGAYPNRFETVYAWIPGTEPDLPGVVFTGHLFEGYTKRGANDNMGGPAIQLEILRALHHLIESGQLPQPRRTIHFIWPNEISGTYEFIRRDPSLVEKWSININMDMVSEGLRNANSWFTMSETPAQLASFYDGLAAAVLNYVWRTNDIVYLGGAPRGRPGGQYFPVPMWEKNGSRDAFRFFIHEATGGSDHIVFNNASVAVPGIEFFTWPDQWYHADTDTPDKGDPTEMKRVAFIGASTAWVSANLTDEMLPDLLQAVSDFGYNRVAERGIPKALETLGKAETGDMKAGILASTIIEAAVERERDAIRSIHEIHSGSRTATRLVDDELASWGAYGDALRGFVLQAAAPGLAGGLSLPEPTSEEASHASRIPRLAPGIRGQEFNMGRFQPAQDYFRDHPGILNEIGLTNAQTSQISNWVNGRRSILTIRDRVAAGTGQQIDVAQVARYLEILEEIGWVEIERSR